MNSLKFGKWYSDDERVTGEYRDGHECSICRDRTEAKICRLKNKVSRGNIAQQAQHKICPSCKLRLSTTEQLSHKCISCDSRW
jgi:hypothetical protein